MCVDWGGALPASVHDLATKQRLDGSAFDALIQSRAEVLSEAGLRQGGIAFLSARNPVTMLADVFATWASGACAAVVDYGYSKREADAFVAFLMPDVRVDAEGSVSPFAGRPEANAGPQSLDSPALLLATSGTTGAPKFVSLSHRAVHARLAGNVAAIGSDSLARTMVALPLSFGHGLIGNCLSACYAGGELFFMDRSLGGIMGLGAAIDTHAITFFSSVPSFWRMAVRGQAPSCETLRRVHVGSAPLSATQAQEIAKWCAPADVWNCYGITETSNWVAGCRIGKDFEANAVGSPLDAARMVVLMADGTIAPFGEGEILVRSASQLSGYHSAPEATAAALVAGWFRTGDLGRIDANGIVILGRLKDEVNVAGFKVNPGEVDIVLAAHPAVAEACAYGRPDAASGEVIAAAVTLKDRAEVSPAELIAFASENLRRIAVPASITIVDTMPLTARGKISRSIVRDSVEGQTS
jgi:acyl-CoA synthetase (AMP-forming)/AMP-acid ligase II